MHDARFALRYLGRNLGFSSLAVVLLALGMMATTAMYSVVYAVVLDPFPYKDVNQLMSVRVSTPGQPGGRLYYSTDQFLEIAERNTIFEGTIASTISDVLWTNGPEPQRIRGNYGTPSTFEVMGVPALVGRVFTPADAVSDSEPVVVLGYRFWQRQFGGDPKVVGTELRLNDRIRRVVGVMPKRFMWRGADVYLPVVLKRGEVVEGVRNVHLLGRLKPNVTEAQAATDLGPIIEELKRREPAQFPDQWRVGLLSFKETFPSSIRENLWILFGAVGLLLLIACANVSNLLLSKATERQKEMTVRAALGASRAGIVRQLLVESLVVAAAAGVLGLLLASIGLHAILSLVPPNTIPDESEVALNMPVLLFSLVVSVLTSVVFGLAPALHATSSDLVSSLRETARSVTGGRRQALLRKSLVVAEIALSLVLLVAAGLLIRTSLAVEQVDVGFRTERVLTMRVPVPERRYPDRERRVAFFQDLMARLSAVPGVESVGVNTGVHPFGNLNAPIEVTGGQPDTRPSLIHQTSADYAKALGIRLLQGRFYSASDVERGLPLALVNQAFARTRLEGQSAVGRTIRIPRLSQPPFGIPDTTFEVVGVVGDTLNRGITNEVGPEVYVPYTLAGRADRVVILARSDVGSITKTALAQVYAIDKEQPVTDVMSVDRALADFAYAEPRFNVALFSVFAVLGLILSVVGVYSVMASSVARQVHEVGVRMALGASPRSVFGMVVGRGARLIVSGVAIGLVASVFAARVLEGYVWRVSTVDLFTLTVVSLILLATGLQACVWPARRASRISPISALKTD
jgi:putative ABC transport system permease protein